jgi:hypothetical protein
LAGNVTSTDSNLVEIVRGEMQPWTDYTQARPPAGGAALCRLLADVLPPTGHTLIVGPHGSDVIEAVAARSARVTVLLRSLSDARTLAAEPRPGDVRFVAGGLDGLAGHVTEPFDAVLAADGLDRVLGADSPDLDWPGRLVELLRHAGAESVVVVGCENAFSLSGLLDRRPPEQRYGDDEWTPLHDDPRRPASAEQFAAALHRAGVADAATYATFSVDGLPHTLLDVRVAPAARPGHLAGRLAVRALEASAAGVPLLAPIGDGAEAAIKAGLLASLPERWLAVRGQGGQGGLGGHSLYTLGYRPGLVVVADLIADDGSWRVTTADTAADGAAEGPADPGAAVRVSPEALPARVPDAETVEGMLFRTAAAGDVPAFRTLAAGLGDWVRARHAEHPDAVTCLDDLQPDGSGFAPGVFGWVASAPVSAADLLAAAWHRWCDRLLSGNRQHPWPPWMTGSDLVGVWLKMAGDAPSPESLRRGREIADALQAAMATKTPEEPDLRTALVRAQKAEQHAFEQAGHIVGLERTIGFRDKQLRTRESRIRAMREEMERLRGSRAFRLALFMQKLKATVRQPRRLARAVKRRLLR